MLHVVGAGSRATGVETAELCAAALKGVQTGEGNAGYEAGLIGGAS